MRTQCNGLWKFLFNALLLLALLSVIHADRTSPGTPARLLAKQTGATQFEEERLEAHKDCTEHKHRLKKRASDEDVDYEVYQGVVGRPGIDFPIYPRIPRTSFSCRSFGNGYFADMETDCQVFHICEEGRKISFLCPNGTIFQQSELTCDWWFKVNCLGSPGYYAESSEILNKQRVQRIRPSVPVSVGFNIVGGGSGSGNSNYKQKSDRKSSQPKQSSDARKSKPERRIDSNEEPPLESVDFDDFSGEKQLKDSGKSKVISNIESNNNDETQITAETASFVGENRRNSYHADTDRTTSESRIGGIAAARHPSASNRRGNIANNNYNNKATVNPELVERARHGQRGQQRYTKDGEKKPLVESFEINSSGERQEPKKPFVLPEKIIKAAGPVEVLGRSNGASNILAESPSGKGEHFDTHTTRTVDKAVPSSTAFYPAGTYSTARRFETTKSTPFYTPTVPTVNKSKTTEGKSHYIKGKVASNSATTPSPNRFNVGSSGSGLFLESSSAPKISTTASPTSHSDSSTSITTLRPIIIGMRHLYETTSTDYRTPLVAHNFFNIDNTEDKKTPKNADAQDYLITTTTPPSTRPTYLPKSGFDSLPTIEAGGDSLLFAPAGPSNSDNLSRNVKGMLKAMDYIKDELKVVDNFGPRAGLEIPPSLGPNAVHSLAQYYAIEKTDFTGNSLNSLGGSQEKSVKAPASVATTTAKIPSTIQELSPPVPKPSDTVSSITTVATPNVSDNADDIKTSLLSERTKMKYSNLFGLQEAKGKKADVIDKGLVDSKSDNSAGKFNNHEPFPQIGSTDATISKIASTPGYRTIAKEFSDALTTYLDTPDKLRKQLQAVRPTPPPVGGKGVVTTVTDSTLFQSGTAASYLPTQSTPSNTRYTTTTPDSIAQEINSKFDYSTVSPDSASTTEVFDTTTYRPSSHKHRKVIEFSGEVLPRGQDSAESDGEILQRANTQSFVNARNNLNTQYNKDAKPRTSGGKNTFVEPKPTENPWNHASQTDFLDPLTINDGLMKETRTTTATPFVKTTTTTTTTTTPLSNAGRGQINVLSSDTGRNYIKKFEGSAEVTTKAPPTPYYYQQRSQESTDSWSDIFNTYDLPRESLPSSSGLQRIANKIFGGLNETEALHLKNVMAQAEQNRQVLSLLLLLIQTCDDNNGKALERSRKHLLNALIDMDSKLKAGKNAYQKAAVGTTTSRTINTTPALAFYTTTTDQQQQQSTTTLSASTTGSGVEETTKFEIRVEDPEEDVVASSTATAAAAGSSSGGGGGDSGVKNSDKRALELLKSLYSLASKFTSRR